MRRQERDDLYEKFESTIYDVQQKSGFKNIILERNAVSWLVRQGTLKYSRNFLQAVGTAPRKSCVI